MIPNLKTLFISENQVKKLISLQEAISLVEKAFKEKGLNKVQMPAKSYLYFQKFNGDLRTMPCYFERLNISGVKIVNAHPDNYKKNFPSVGATLILVNPKNGFPYCIMQANYLTALRTAAASAVATKYLALKNLTSLALIGAGYQAKFQVLAMKEVLPLKEVFVYDKNKNASLKLKQQLKNIVQINICENVKDTVLNQKLITTVTSSHKPLIKKKWVSDGAHINAIGADAPYKQELDENILLAAKIFLDDWEQGCHSGEVNVALRRNIITKKNITGEIAEVVLKKRGRTNAEEITIFDSTGLALEDVICGDYVYKKWWKIKR